MIAHLDCSTGVSGDKFLGALLHAGSTSGAFTREHLERLLAALAPEGRVIVSQVRSQGVAALSVSVDVTERAPHRSWAAIRALLQDAPLDQRVRTRALAAFELLAEAEAKAHGTTPENVHFHEVGATDSILDVVGVSAGIEALGIDLLTCSAIATGWGTVSTSHGVLPVPAPATAYLLEGVPTVPGPQGQGGADPGELTTPTGAALVKAFAATFGPSAPMVPRTFGYGAGTRDIGQPNVCRITLGEAIDGTLELQAETVSLLETNIDHLSPEAAAVASQQLLAEGVLDVWTSPIVMKKGRAAFLLSALVTADTAEHFSERVVALTGSLGVRMRVVERRVAARDAGVVETPYGPVRLKVAAGRVRAEADDVAAIARENGVSFSIAEAEIGALLALDENDD